MQGDFTSKLSRREWVEREQGKHFCQCNCGQSIKIRKQHHSDGIPKFAHGHWTRFKDRDISGTPDLKRCPKCGEVKARTEFHKRSDRPGGLQSKCNMCTNTQQNKERSRQYYWDNKERLRVQAKAYYEEHRDEDLERSRKYRAVNHGRVLVYLKQWREENPEKARVTSKAYYEANKEEIARKAKEYREARPEVARVSNRNRRAKQREAQGRHTTEDVKRQYEQQKGKCYWCSGLLNGTYHVDHIIPISRGGGNGPGNICCACPPCNLSKHNKMPWEFSDRLF